MEADSAYLTSSSVMNVSTEVLNLSDVQLSIEFQFWFLLICEIPSIICYLFVLIYMLTRKRPYETFHNHSILILLFLAFSIVLFDYTWAMDCYRRGGKVWPESSVFCQVWWLFEYGAYDACTVFLAWTSFERHILIFYPNLVATKQRLFFIHYLPLIVISFYLSIFYIYVIFFPSCENEYDFSLPVCGAYPCYLTIEFLGLWNIIGHGIIPTFLIVLFNITLLGRVLWQKRRRLNWKRYRKMAFQLLSISVLYLSINLPLMITFVVQLSGYSEWGVQEQRYLYFFSVLIQYLLPFVCLPYLPDIWLNIKTLVIRGRQRVVPALILRSVRGPQQETRV